MLVTNVRHPHDFRGDLAAMIGSAQVGERRLLALASEFGWPTTYAAIEAVLDGAERQARAVIAEWKDGVYKRRGDPRRRRPRHTRHPRPRHGHQARQRPQGRSLGFARAGGGLRQLVLSEHALGGGGGARLSDRSPHAEERRRVPADRGDRQGGHRRLGERGRAGDAVHQPLRPGDHRGDHQGAGAGLSRSRDGRLGPPLPHRASRGAIRAPARRFIWHMFQARPGGGASPAGDGWPGAGEWQAAGGIKFGSLEVTEVRFPLFFRRHEFRPGSRRRRPVSRRPRLRAGDGGGDRRARARQHRRRRRALRRLRHPRRQDGLPHDYRAALRQGEPPRAIKTKEVGIAVRPGDVFRVESGGGGGWGDPGEAHRRGARATRSSWASSARPRRRARPEPMLIASASTSAAPSPTWSRWTTTGRATWPRSPPRRRIPRSA